MTSFITEPLITFLEKNHFINPKIINIADNPSSWLCTIQEEGGKKSTATITKSQELRELYQLNNEEFSNYINLQTNYIHEISLRIPSPSLININNSFKQTYQDLQFYIAEFIPGESKELTQVKAAEKSKIAQLLAKIHQEDVSQYDEKIFAFKTHFLARSWQKLIDNNGLEFVEQLAENSIDISLKSLISKIRTHINYETIANPQGPLVMAHSDVKPKNIIWGKEEQIYLTFWDDFCMMRAELDFIDTLISWTVQLNTNNYFFNSEEAALFRAHYCLPLSIEEADIYTLAAKWIFWIIFCYSRNRSMEVHKGFLMLKFLALEQDKILNMNRSFDRIIGQGNNEK